MATRRQMLANVLDDKMSYLSNR